MICGMALSVPIRVPTTGKYLLNGKIMLTTQVVIDSASDVIPVNETGAAENVPEKAGKSGRRGRPKGSKNRTGQIDRLYILNELRPVDFLARIMRGEKFMRAIGDGKKKVACYPTLAESAHAAEVLARKALPDLKASELSGPDGQPIQTQTIDNAEAARRILFMLRRGQVEAPHE